MKLVYLGIVKSYNPKPQQDLTTHYIASISSLKAETTRFFQVFEQLRSDYRQIIKSAKTRFIAYSIKKCSPIDVIFSYST
jgi:hypothetical protein